MKFREFEVDIKNDGDFEYLVISQVKVNENTGSISHSYITLERHQLFSLVDALLDIDGI